MDDLDIPDFLRVTATVTTADDLPPCKVPEEEVLPVASWTDEQLEAATYDPTLTPTVKQPVYKELHRREKAKRYREYLASRSPKGSKI